MWCDGTYLLQLDPQRIASSQVRNWRQQALSRLIIRKVYATPFSLNYHNSSTIRDVIVASQMSTSFLYSAVYDLLVYNPSRACLSPECEFNLNRTRSLSYSYVSPNQTCLPYMLPGKVQSRSTNPRLPTFNLTPDRCGSIRCIHTSKYVLPQSHR